MNLPSKCIPECTADIHQLIFLSTDRDAADVPINRKRPSPDHVHDGDLDLMQKI
jgi:hypothetical protein